VDHDQRHPGDAGPSDEELGQVPAGVRAIEGGFTLSGGEPLMQHRFAVKLLSAAPGMGIHTALDSNGYYGHRLSDAGPRQIDLVLLDLKGWDSERHRHLTGMEKRPTLEFAAGWASGSARSGCGSSRARADRRRGADHGDCPFSPPGSAVVDASTSCPSTRWALQVEAARPPLRVWTTSSPSTELVERTWRFFGAQA
jgi:hypothetical protein